jgi:hypothetical protein
MTEMSITKRLRIAMRVAAVLSLALLAGVPAGCGGDTCIIINTARPAFEWNVTFAVTGSLAAHDVEGVVDIGDGCDDDCFCRRECDCDALWIAADGERVCEPLLAAGYEESLDEPRTLRVWLHADRVLAEPAAILRCAYRGTREPVPSDFRVEVDRSSGSDVITAQPTLAASEISPRFGR